MESPESPEATYRVLTWDPNSEEYTPQDGIPELVTGFRGLLMAVRLLKKAGYEAYRTHCDSDSSVLIERVSPDCE